MLSLLQVNTSLADMVPSPAVDKFLKLNINPLEFFKGFSFLSFTYLYAKLEDL